MPRMQWERMGQVSHHEGTTLYLTTLQKAAPPPPAIRAREADWHALTLDEQMEVLAFLRWDIGSESERVRTFLRRHYKEQM